MKSYIIRLKLAVLVFAILIGCNLNEEPPVYTECQMNLFGDWNVSEHYLFKQNDTIKTEYNLNLRVEFNEDNTGTTDRISVDESFTWTCSGDTVTINKALGQSAYLDHGEYLLLSVNADTIIMQNHQLTGGFLPNGLPIKWEGWRTWLLTPK